MFDVEIRVKENQVAGLFASDPVLANVVLSKGNVLGNQSFYDDSFEYIIYKLMPKQVSKEVFVTRCDGVNVEISNFPIYVLFSSNDYFTKLVPSWVGLDRPIIDETITEPVNGILNNVIGYEQITWSEFTKAQNPTNTDKEKPDGTQFIVSFERFKGSEAKRLLETETYLEFLEQEEVQALQQIWFPPID